MNDGGGNGGCSFKVKHGSDAAEIAYVHEAGAPEICAEFLLEGVVRGKLCREYPGGKE